MMARTADFAARNMRLTILICVVAICGSFAAAAVLQTQFGRDEALSRTEALQSARASDLAHALSDRLDSYAALGMHFANGTLSPDALGALSGTAMPALANIAVLDANGSVRTALHPPGFGPLPQSALVLARARRTLLTQGEHLVLAYPADGAIVVVALNAGTLVPPEILDRGAIVAAGGRVIVHGRNWSGAIVPDAIAEPSAATRIATNGDVLIAAAPVPGWPLLAASAFDFNAVGANRYGSLPLYLFIIIGPALVGAALAMLFVSEYERRTRASAAIRALRETPRFDSKLLVRLAEAERRAAEAERAKTEFVAHMSHELRTPLNAIIGFAEVIECGVFGAAGHPKYLEYARDIGVAGRSLHSKIGDVLEFANVEAGRYPIHCIDTDVYAVACECVNEMAGRAFSRRISLSLDPSPPIRAHADAVAVKRILGNLLANALDYTPLGGRVRVLLSRQDGMICVCVRDTGLGFDPAEAATLGQPFARFSRSGSHTGQGLGLAIAVALAERMKGEVRLTSNHGAGMTAELRLPKA